MLFTDKPDDFEFEVGVEYTFFTRRIFALSDDVLSFCCHVFQNCCLGTCILDQETCFRNVFSSAPPGSLILLSTWTSANFLASNLATGDLCYHICRTFSQNPSLIRLGFLFYFLLDFKQLLNRQDLQGFARASLSVKCGGQASLQL